MKRTPHPLRGAAAALLALLGSLGASGAARAQEPLAGAADIEAGVGAEIEEVRFRGASRFTPDQLSAAIRTRATDCTLIGPFCWLGWGIDERYLDLPTLAADELRLRLLYYEHGYRNATVTTEVVPEDEGEVVVVFDIDEGEPVRVASITYGGEAERVRPLLGGAVSIDKGDPLDLPRLQAARDSLQSRLRNAGYARAEVLAGYLIPTDSPRIARLNFDVFPGNPSVFGEIRVVGADAVSPAAVRRMLTFSEGDTYREEDIVESQRQLYGLDVFTHASIQPHPEQTAGDSIPVTVSVNEGDLHRVRLGAGVNSLDCLNAEGRWVSRSFLGGARRLEVRARASNLLTDELRYGEWDLPCSEAGTGAFGRLNGSLNADFVQPWFLGTRNVLGAGLGLERRSVPGVFVRDSRGGYVSLARQVGSRITVALAYRPALTSFLEGDDPFFCVSFLACDPESVRALQDPRWLAPLTLSFVHDASNALFSPSRGYVFRLDGEVASGVTGSAFRYVRVAGELAWYRGLFGDVVLASHLRPGWARSIEDVAGDDDLGLHPQRRFFAGGPNSVRGFAQSRLGPKILAINGSRLADAARGAGCVASAINSGECDARSVDAELFEPRPTGGTGLLEGSIELRFPLVGALRGVAFVDAGQVWNDEFDDGELAWSPGLGVRYYSPIGPIRIDLGYNMMGAERLPVRATAVEVCGRYETAPGDPDEDRVLVPLDPCVAPEPGVYYPEPLLGNTNDLVSLEQPVDWDPRGSLGDFWDRIQIHFSIGQAF